MATSCKYEFQAKHFGFTDSSADLFHHLQWCKNRWIFLVYRFFMMAYCVGWFIYAYAVQPQDRFWQFLSNWTEVVMILYFLVAFCFSLYAVVIRRRDTTNDDIRFHAINWLMFNVAVVSAFQISIFYWALLAPGRTRERNLQPVTFHIHATNSILLLIDLFMVAFPVRFLHFIYTVFYGIVYGIFLLILHATGVNSKVYDVIDFEMNPGTAAAYLVVSVIVFPIALHSIVFGLYHLRAFIARKTVLKYDLPPAGAVEPSTLEMGNINPAFETSHKVDGTLA